MVEYEKRFCQRKIQFPEKFNQNYTLKFQKNNYRIELSFPGHILYHLF